MDEREEKPNHLTTPGGKKMSPRIEVSNTAGESAFVPKASKQNGKKNNQEGNNMSTEEVINEVAVKSNTSVISVAELYAEMEAEVVAHGSVQKNTGVTARIKTIVDSIFAATQKDKLLLSAVVKIVEKQEGRGKLYNLTRSIANSKSASAKYGLLTEDGRTYIVRKN